MDPLLKSLKLWLDPVPRSGPENMAVDEWLLETIGGPVLRVYEWDGVWGSLGCFCCLNQAIDNLPDRQLVRRPTGGGIVDHQHDWTYSLVIPKTEELFRIRALESYRLVHEVLSLVLNDSFKLVSSVSNAPELGGVCFERPVTSDVVDSVGNKIAGAGQRRTKDGLLHQGSVLGRCKGGDSIDRSHRLSGALSASWESIELEPPTEVIRWKVGDRFGNDAWTRRR
ncbi:hypothetical protein OVA24_13585 [Luteolibacter sp. SL250]|uniref:lipoyl protein ligase domain-containing protein n=1 Tax=Luteolibacter sp. SL250 TaxID=2995170 RepID=UPI0022722196|nr:hypothetical protein [Luteolibacter sp. SL250]WAC18269.1 hypothetical protein OVA24_13585 [Luteolibacter sp. SL250]